MWFLNVSDFMRSKSVLSKMQEHFGGVFVLLKFWQFSTELPKTWSSGATECAVWIGNCNVKVWKSTEHKLHKIWRSLKFCTNSGKRAQPRNSCKAAAYIFRPGTSIDQPVPLFKEILIKKKKSYLCNSTSWSTQKHQWNKISHRNIKKDLLLKYDPFQNSPSMFNSVVTSQKLLI